MKNLITNILDYFSFHWIGVSFFIFINGFAFANENKDRLFIHTESKNRSHSFYAPDNSVLSIENKYGNIRFLNWEKDSVSIQVSITAHADRKDHAEMLLGLAEIEFKTLGSELQANLQWGKELSSTKRTAVETMLTMRSDQKIQIDFTVMLPKKMTIKVENRFGDVELPLEIKKCFIQLHHGDLRGEKIVDARSIHVRYGKVDIKEIQSADFDLVFSDLDIQKGEDISLKSSNSKITIESVSLLQIKSTNDKIHIEQLEKISGNISFSTLRVKTLGNSAQLVVKYGSILFKKVLANFSGINISGSGTDVDLNFESNAAFKCNITMENQKSFSSGFSLGKLNETRVDKTVFYEGSIGKNGTETKLMINLKSSHLRLDSAP